MSKKWLFLALKFAVSGGCLYWLFSTKVDLAAAGEGLVAVAPGMLVLAGGLSLVQVVICMYRWSAVLVAIGAPLPLITLLRLFYIGSFFNQTLPSSVGGDAVRIYLAHRAGQPLSGAINGVMLERVAIVLALTLLVLAMQPLFLGKLDPGKAPWVLSGVVSLTVLAVIGIGFLTFLNHLPASLRHWRLIQGLVVLGGDTRRLFLRRASAARVIALSLAGHVNVTLVVYVLALGLGLKVTVVDCLALFPLVLLATTLPISIAGWGVRELAMVKALALVGVPGDGAVALSLLFGLINVALSIPGGLVWLASAERRKDAVPSPPAIDEARGGRPA